MDMCRVANLGPPYCFLSLQVFAVCKSFCVIRAFRHRKFTFGGAQSTAPWPLAQPPPPTPLPLGYPWFAIVPAAKKKVGPQSEFWTGQYRITKFQSWGYGGKLEILIQEIKVKKSDFNLYFRCLHCLKDV